MPTSLSRPTRLLVGVAAAAKELGISREALAQNVREGIVPNHGTAARAKIDIEEARAIREGTLQPERRGREFQSATPQLSQLQKMRMAVEATRVQKAKIQIAELEGRLVNRAEVEAAIFGAARDLRQALLALSARLAGDLAGLSEPTACRALLDRNVRATLDDFTAALRARNWQSNDAA